MKIPRTLPRYRAAGFTSVSAVTLGSDLAGQRANKKADRLLASRASMPSALLYFSSAGPKSLRDGVGLRSLAGRLFRTGLASDIQNDAAIDLPLLEAVKNIVDRCQWLLFDGGLDLALGGELQRFFKRCV